MKLKLAFCISLLSAVVAGPVGAVSLNIDIGQAQGTPSSTFGGVGGAQPGVWNVITSSNPASLVDLNGGGTSVTLTSDFDAYGGSFGALSGDERALAADNGFSNAGSSWFVSLSGLANGLYDLVLYAPTHPGVALTGSVNGISIGTHNVNSSTFADHAFAFSALNITDGTLNIQGVFGNFSGLAGLQLTDLSSTTTSPVPVPAALPLLATALLGLGFSSWRRNRAAA